MSRQDDLKNVFSRETRSSADDTMWSDPRQLQTIKTNPFDDSSSQQQVEETKEAGKNPFDDSFSFSLSQSQPREEEIVEEVSLTHSRPPRHQPWDADRDFPVMEIARIQKKTKKIRQKRRTDPTEAERGEPSVFSDFATDQDLAAFHVIQPSRSHTTTATGGESHSSSADVKSVRKYKARTWSTGTGGQSRNSRQSSQPLKKDSLAELMDQPTESHDTKSSREQRSTPTLPSPAAEKAQKNLLQGFAKQGKPRSTTSREPTDDTTPLNTSAASTQGTSHDVSYESSNQDKNLTLHDLCGEAASPNDIAWRNALYLLSVQPQLAGVSDEGFWTPLHICCLGECPPPDFMIRALLYAYPNAARQPDEGNRLPLHLVAACSGDVPTLQLLVEEYPPALYQTDAHGFTPLHLMVRNLRVELTAEHMRVLLGLTLPYVVEQERQKRQVLLQRRGEHLELPLNEVTERILYRPRPVTRFHRSDEDILEAQVLASYPQDVQLCFRKLSQWKYQQREQSINDTQEDDDAIEVEWNFDDETNPAAMATPNGTQLPIHMVVRRAIVARSVLQSSSSLQLDESRGSSGEEGEEFDGSNDNNEKGPEVGDDKEVPSSASSTESRPSVPNVLAVLRVLVAAYPEALVVRDDQGQTPLLAALLVEDADPCLAVVELLLGKRSPGYESLPAWAEDLPLHRISQARFVNPAMIPTIEGNQLPLHLVAEELVSNYVLMDSIHESYPGAIHVQDSQGRTPLHLALHNYRRIPADPRVVSLLLSDQVAQIRDDNGDLPFDLLIESAPSLPAKQPRAWSFASQSNGNTAAMEASTVFQRFFSASILGAGRPNGQCEAEYFLRRIRSLPLWLRKQACAANFLQELLLEELASPWKCAFILFDGLLLVILITMFRLQVKEFVDVSESGKSLSSFYTFSVYCTAVMRLVFQVVLGYLSASLGEFKESVLFNVWCWIDCSAMLLSIVTSASLYGTKEYDELLTLSTVSTGMLWLALLAYLSRWWYGMAVFTGGLSKISCHIAWPLLVVGILIVAFAQMFYTVMQIDCPEEFAVTCSVRDAYRVVYLLLRGEPLVDVQGNEQMTTGVAALIAVFLLVSLLFFIGLVVTILIGASHFDYDDIALESYWEPKLGFVLSMNELGFPSPWSLRLTKKLERAWDGMISPLIGGEAKKGEHWYTSRAHTNVVYWTLPIVSLVVIPIWLLLGSVTLGLLWPPQIRRLVFRPFGRSRKKQQANMAAEQAASQISGMRNEIMQLKAMSYERTGDVQKEIRDLKDLLSTALNDDYSAAWEQ